jgi:hypothetical protein
MMQTKWWKGVIASAALAVAVLGIRQFALAQQGPNPPGQGGFVGRGGGFGGGTQIAASGNYVYLVRGNMIYRLDANTLAVKAQAELPMMANAPVRSGNGVVYPPPPDNGTPPPPNTVPPPPPDNGSPAPPTVGQ